MSNSADKRKLLAAEYVIGTMPLRARDRLLRRLRRDTALREEVTLWEGLLQPLSDDISPEPLPKTGWDSLESKLDSQSRRLDRERSVSRRRLAFWQIGFVGAMSLAIASLLFSFGPFKPEQGFAGDFTAVLNAGDQPAWLVRADLTRSELEVTRLMPMEAPEAASLQLWCVSSNTPKPVAVGLVTVDDRQMLRITDKQAFMKAELLAISMEPVGGSPMDEPTGPVMYKGELTTHSSERGI